MPATVLDRLFGWAESPTLLVDALLANDFYGVLYPLAARPEVREAISTISAEPQMAARVLERLTQTLVAELPVDEYHRYDAAICAYIFVLARSNVQGLVEAVRMVRATNMETLVWSPSMCEWALQEATGSESRTARETTPSAEREDLSDEWHSADGLGGDSRAEISSDNEWQVLKGGV